MTIELPNFYASYSLNFLNAIQNRLNNAKSSEEIYFDFSKVTNFEPFSMLIIGHAIRNCFKHYDCKFSNVDTSVNKPHCYGGAMSFFKYIDPSCLYGEEVGHQGGEAHIPIRLINIENIKNEYQHKTYFQEGIKEKAKELARILSPNQDELRQLLGYCITEIIRNAPEHGKTNNVWICAQKWAGKGPHKFDAQIAILDDGIGIFNSINKNEAHRNFITDNKATLKYVLKPGISEAFDPQGGKMLKDWDNSGYGLYMISQICKEIGGEFCIASLGNYLKIDKQGNETYGETNINGTAIELQLPTMLDDFNFKSLATKIKEKGEAEACQSFNAFKTASKASSDFLL